VTPIKAIFMVVFLRRIARAADGAASTITPD
jgi:hypothetical protein